MTNPFRNLNLEKEKNRLKFHDIGNHLEIEKKNRLIETMEMFSINFLYHFTDKENLDSIKKSGGLYSWEYCERNNIKIPFPGGNTLSRNLDKEKNLQNYVRLSFAEEHPMRYMVTSENRKIDPVTLNIKPEILFLENIKFSNMNATDKNCEISSDVEFLNSMNLFLRFSDYLGLNDEEKKLYQAEVLVLEHIPLSFIENL